MEVVGNCVILKNLCNMRKIPTSSTPCHSEFHAYQGLPAPLALTHWPPSPFRVMWSWGQARSVSGVFTLSLVRQCHLTQRQTKPWSSTASKPTFHLLTYTHSWRGNRMAQGMQLSWFIECYGKQSLTPSVLKYISYLFCLLCVDFIQLQKLM